MNIPNFLPEPFSFGLVRRRWYSIHLSYIQLSMRLKADVLFFGDSLFDNVRDMQQWEVLFRDMNCLNFCIRADRIQNVLWRLLHGELKHLRPRVLVLSVGKNNFGNTPQQIGHGILKCIRLLRSRLPETDIIVPSLVSRIGGLRLHDEAVNAFVKLKTARWSRVHTVKISRKFLHINFVIQNPVHIACVGSRVVGKHFQPLHKLIVQLIQSNEFN